MKVRTFKNDAGALCTDDFDPDIDEPEPDPSGDDFDAIEGFLEDRYEEEQAYLDRVDREIAYNNDAYVQALLDDADYDDEW